MYTKFGPTNAYPCQTFGWLFLWNPANNLPEYPSNPRRTAPSESERSAESRLINNSLNLFLEMQSGASLTKYLWEPLLSLAA
jgi:hypothetical protein